MADTANPKPVNGKYTVFISYRRNGGTSSARLMRNMLQDRGVTVVLDLEMLRNGRFDTNLLKFIESCQNFVLILPKGGLDRCADEDDWVRREVVHALELNKNIIPVMLDEFKWPRALPDALANLPNYNGIRLHNDFTDSVFNAAVDNLVDMLERDPDKPDLPGETAPPAEPAPASAPVDVPLDAPRAPKQAPAARAPRKRRVWPWLAVAGVAVAAALCAALLLKPAAPPPSGADAGIYVYQDEGSGANRFSQKAKMEGTDGALVFALDENWKEKPFAGKTCIRCRVDTKPGSWGGWLFLNGYAAEGKTGLLLNDGATPGQGENLTGMTELRFFAKGQTGGEKVEFFCFGFGFEGEWNTPVVVYPDSALKQTLGVVELTGDWKEYAIPLDASLDLSNIACGFGFVCGGEANAAAENVFYLDDIRFVGGER